MFFSARRIMVLCAAIPTLFMAGVGVLAAEPGNAQPPYSKAPSKTATGEFLLAQSSRDPQVCCYRQQPSGAPIFFMAPKSQCESSGGREVSDGRCKQPDDPQVCCSTPNGFFNMSRRQCKSARGRPVSMARCNKPNDPSVCCRTPNGFFSMSRRQCKSARGREVAAARCRNADPRVCCMNRQPNGRTVFNMRRRSVCKSSGGREVGAARCRRPNNRQVCCSTQRGFVKMSTRQCRRAGRPVAMARCNKPNDPRVCCSTRNGFFQMSRRQCTSARGRPVSMARCRGSNDPKMCCALPNGRFLTMTEKSCRSARGRKAPAARCSPRAQVCCKRTSPDGNVRYESTTRRTCQRTRGTVVSSRYCRRTLRRLRSLDPSGGG